MPVPQAHAAGGQSPLGDIEDGHAVLDAGGGGDRHLGTHPEGDKAVVVNFAHVNRQTQPCLLPLLAGPGDPDGLVVVVFPVITLVVVLMLADSPS